MTLTDHVRQLQVNVENDNDDHETNMEEERNKLRRLTDELEALKLDMEEYKQQCEVERYEK